MADTATISIYALVTLGAVLRVLAPLMGELYLPVLAFGGIAWSAAFALFALAYGPMLVTPRV